MTNDQFSLSSTFQRFFDSEKSSGIILILCTLISLLLANSVLGAQYIDIWSIPFAGLTIAHWINDGLMAIFFLFIGLELEHELYKGELASLKKALLPVIAAIGGIVCPALIHFTLNANTATQPGIGIPMATDIAFALGALALLGSRIPLSLKFFLAALAVIDDLGAIIVIAVFYTEKIIPFYLVAAVLVFATLILLNRVFRIMMLTPYLIGGAVLWFCMLKSGVHATIAGVVLAFAIPFTARTNDEVSPSRRLEQTLHKPVAFLILPIFALANTGIIINSDWAQDLASPNSLGIMAGLIVGKPLGITVFCLIAVSLGLCKLPTGLNWKHIFGAGLLGGIGFTMSIFITNLAFVENPAVITASKIAVLLASSIAGLLGFLWLRYSNKNITS
jgi:Na+:H+ antiporter, NhaA family